MTDSPSRSEARVAAVVLVVLAVSVARMAWVERHVASHAYVHEALAFSHGQVALDTNVVDAVEWTGSYRCTFPPFPAVALIPFVMLFGEGTKTLLLTPILGALIAVLTYRLARKNGLLHDRARWLALALPLGTSVWMCVRYPVDTYFAHCWAVLFACAALNELFGKQRGAVVGVWIGLALLSRLLTGLMLPFACAVLVGARRDDRPLSGAVRASLAATVTCAACAGFYLYLNQVRFGAPFDFGYAHLAETGWYGYRLTHWGNFSFVYLPSNLVRMFLSGFAVEFSDPGRMIPHMGAGGTALTFACPFLFWSLPGRIRESRMANVVGWSCVAAIVLAVLCHKSALGGWQIHGLRYSLDFVPLLFVFLARALRDAGEWSFAAFKILVCTSIGLNVVAFGLIPLLEKTLTLLPH
jgi:hypothetical protein